MRLTGPYMTREQYAAAVQGLPPEPAATPPSRPWAVPTQPAQPAQPAQPDGPSVLQAILALADDPAVSEDYRRAIADVHALLRAANGRP